MIATPRSDTKLFNLWCYISTVECEKRNKYGLGHGNQSTPLIQNIK